LAKLTAAAVLCVGAILLISYAAVPAFLSRQAEAIDFSASRHGVPADWLSAVLYTEMLGTETQMLDRFLPGDDSASGAIKQTLLGLHLLTFKQAQWQAKTFLALAGMDPTIGPAGIRVTVGREIRSELQISSSCYVPDGPLERLSMIADLSSPVSSVEYLAANLRRGQQRLQVADRGDWAASARWHNTGVVYDSAIVRPEDWLKGTRYIERVESNLDTVLGLLELPSTGHRAAQPVTLPLPLGAGTWTAWLPSAPRFGR
jgi:hypothetical protein